MWKLVDAGNRWTPNSGGLSRGLSNLSNPGGSPPSVSEIVNTTENRMHSVQSSLSTLPPAPIVPEPVDLNLILREVRNVHRKLGKIESSILPKN